MVSPEPPGDDAAGDAEETVDAPIAPLRRPRLPVEKLELPVYQPPVPARFGVRFWLAVLAGAVLALVVVLLVVLA